MFVFLCAVQCCVVSCYAVFCMCFVVCCGLPFAFRCALLFAVHCVSLRVMLSSFSVFSLSLSSCYPLALISVSSQSNLTLLSLCTSCLSSSQKIVEKLISGRKAGEDGKEGGKREVDSH